MKVVLLAGGRGTRLAEETHAIPKPMVAVGGKPLLWHIMRHYASFGYDDFVVALGYKGYVIKEYFANYLIHECDLSIKLSDGVIEVITRHREAWRITLVDTGGNTMTGGRLRRLAPLLPSRFMLTYGDGLSDVPIDQLISYHEARGGLATVTAVHPPARFGALAIDDLGMVTRFQEKPSELQDRINGGFFVMEPGVLSLLPDDSCVLENEPLSLLASQGQLAAFQHDGFWMPMDTLRERDELNRLWDSGRAPWLGQP